MINVSVDDSDRDACLLDAGQLNKLSCARDKLRSRRYGRRAATSLNNRQSPTALLPHLFIPPSHGCRLHTRTFSHPSNTMQQSIKAAAWPPLLQGARAASCTSSAALPLLAQAFSSSSQQQQHGLGILEIREYTLHPVGSKQFMKLAAENAALRSKLLPFLG